MSKLLKVYNKLDIEVSRAEGKYLWDKQGKKYLDMFSGLAVANLGHRPDAVLNAVKETAEKYLHLSNLFIEEGQEKLAEKIVDTAFSGSVFFSNSGAEANETAIKAARKYFNGERYEIITFMNSFHGRTLATLSATGQKRFREGFGPMPGGFVHSDYNYLASVEDKINHNTCAVMAEVIQGEGGVNVGTDDFIRGLRDICSRNNILLIIDEIQTGVGRTGTMWGYQHYGITPDIVSMGKALGGGLPLGATLISDKVAESLKPGDHGSTFGGNPVACAASLATFNSIDSKLLEEIKEKGDYFIQKLEEVKHISGAVKDIRGRGLMIGMELDTEGKPLVNYLLDKGIIVNCTQEKVIRFLPSFVIEKTDIDELAGNINKYFRERL